MTDPHNIPNPVATATVVGGALASAAGSVAQTANDAAGSVPQGGATVAWAGTAVAVTAVLIQLYQQWSAVRRREKAAAAQDALDEDTREHATWGDLYKAETKLRSEAEGRLMLLEGENRRLAAQNESQQVQLDDLKDELKNLRKGAGKAIQKVNEKAQAVADRVAAVETAQGSTSDLHLPTTPSE